MLLLQQAPRKTRRPPHNGVVVWEGKSKHDGAPLVVVLTGLRFKSENPKTGPMLQCWVFRSDMAPHVAIKQGADESVCNNCPLRAFLVRQRAKAERIPTRHKPPMCYVSPVTGLHGVWDGFSRGLYPRADRPTLRRLLRGHRVRLGAYGNFSNVPTWVVRLLVRASDGHTLYDHNWRSRRAQPLRQYAMASVSSEQEKGEANRMGWRTFRVKRPGESVLPDEVVCPASEEGGKRTNCYRCRLCQGTSKRARNVVIDDHGPTSERSLANVDRMVAERARGRLALTVLPTRG